MSSFVRVSCIAVALAAACGGATTSSINGGGTSGDTGAGSGTVVGGGTVVGSGTVAMAGTNGGGTTGTAATSGTGGGTTGATAVPGQIKCGTSTCEGATPVCCVDARGSSCAASEADCAADAGRAVVVLNCTGKATCTNGDVCCAATQRPDGGRGVGELVTECAAQCGGAGGGGGGGEQVCAVNSDCAAGDTCVLVGAMAAYGICVPGLPGLGGRDAGGGRPVFDGGARPVFDGGGRRIRDASID